MQSNEYFVICCSQILSNAKKKLTNNFELACINLKLKIYFFIFLAIKFLEK